MNTSIRKGRRLLLACAVTVIASGCAARVYSSGPSQSYVYPGDDSFVYEETVPVNIETYPHYYYGDAYAYYVDGRWYRRGPRGWGYYRQEPPELARHRGYVQQAPDIRSDVRPDVPRARPYVQQAPEVAPQRPYERQVPETRERPYVRPPEAQRERPPVPGTPPPNRGAAEAQPRRDEPRPDAPRPAPPAERRPTAPHEDHAAPDREHRGP